MSFDKNVEIFKEGHTSIQVKQNYLKQVFHLYITIIFINVNCMAVLNIVLDMNNKTNFHF